MKRAKKPIPAKKKTLKPRNPVARSPLLAKGGPHDKTMGARRRKARVALMRSLKDPASFE